jgi:hypothetical protein
VFYHDKADDKIIDIKTTLLEPGQSTPLQDFENSERHKNVKIAIRPRRHKKWGAEYKFIPMKVKMNPEINTEWPHMPSYTIVKKVQTPLANTFDFVLLPPMII